MAQEVDAITPAEPSASVGASTTAGQDKKPESAASPTLSPITERDTEAGNSSSFGGGVERYSSGVEINPADPMNFGRHRRDNVSKKQMKIDHPNAAGKHKLLKKFYTQQNELIDQFLGSSDEERVAVEEDARLGPKIRFAVYASFTVNFFLFIIQLYAAISTGSLSVLSADPIPDVSKLCQCY